MLWNGPQSRIYSARGSLGEMANICTVSTTIIMHVYMKVFHVKYVLMLMKEKTSVMPWPPLNCICEPFCIFRYSGHDISQLLTLSWWRNDPAPPGPSQPQLSHQASSMTSDYSSPVPRRWEVKLSCRAISGQGQISHSVSFILDVLIYE